MADSKCCKTQNPNRVISGSTINPNNHLQKMANNPESIMSLLDKDRDDGVKVLKQYLQHVTSVEVGRYYVMVIPVLLEWCLESRWIDNAKDILRQPYCHEILQPLLGRWIMKFCTNTHHVRRKFLPMFGQGVTAQTPKPGMEYTLRWLKNIRLHKYWPFISHFTYEELLSITEENFEKMVKIIGAFGIKKGARQRLILYIGKLQRRSKVIDLPQTTVPEILQKIYVLKRITETPLSTGLDPDGTHLLSCLKKALNDVVDAVEYSLDNQTLLAQVIELFDLIITCNEVFSKYVKDILLRRTLIEQKLMILKEYNSIKDETSKNNECYKAQNPNSVILESTINANNHLQQIANDPESIMSLLDEDRDDGVKLLKQYLQHATSIAVAPDYIIVVSVLLEWCLESKWIEDAKDILRQPYCQEILQPLLGRWIIKFCTNTYNARSKFLPMLGQGVTAQTPKPGMEYTLRWLKNIRLHKYWPFISHFTYEQLLSITEKNFEKMVKKIGAFGIKKGARQKLILYIGKLQRRSKVIDLPQTTIFEIHQKIYVLKRITETPLSTGLDPDGTHLLSCLKKALNDVVDAVEYSMDNQILLKQLIELFDLIITCNEVFSKYVKDILLRRTSIEQKLMKLSEPMDYTENDSLEDVTSTTYRHGDVTNSLKSEESLPENLIWSIDIADDWPRGNVSSSIYV